MFKLNCNTDTNKPNNKKYTFMGVKSKEFSTIVKFKKKQVVLYHVD